MKIINYLLILSFSICVHFSPVMATPYGHLKVVKTKKLARQQKAKERKTKRLQKFFAKAKKKKKKIVGLLLIIGAIVLIAKKKKKDQKGKATETKSEKKYRTHPLVIAMLIFLVLAILAVIISFVSFFNSGFGLLLLLGG